MILLGCAIACLAMIVTLESRFNDFEEIPIVSQVSIPPAIPTILSIDNIDVHAPIEPVGLVNNEMGTPTTADAVSWYSLGTTPGDTGSAVMAGHVNWDGGQDAVFTKLHTLEIGDAVSVTDSHRNKDYFIVTKIQQYKADDDTTEVFSSNDGLAHLNLITCAGVWNHEKKTHESRLVVFTEKI
jgi:sortase A